MKVILGTPGAYKTTCLLSIAYTWIDKWWKEREELEEEKGTKIDEPVPYAIYITSKRKLNENQLIFGTYSEVTIDVLKNIQMKYIESFESLVEYLMDFHLLEMRPSIVIVDGMELFCTNSYERKLSQLTTANRKLKADYLSNLICHLEKMYNKEESKIQFIWGQRIFSTIPDASLATKERIAVSTGEFEFMTKLYSKYTQEVFLLLTSPNAGGEALNFDDSEDEKEDLVEVKAKNDPDERTHIAEYIFQLHSLVEPQEAGKEPDFIKSKILALYKIHHDPGWIFEGKEAKISLKRLEAKEQSDNEESKQEISFDEPNSVELFWVDQLRDHILGDAKMEYGDGDNMDLEVTEGNSKIKGFMGGDNPTEESKANNKDEVMEVDDPDQDGKSSETEAKPKVPTPEKSKDPTPDKSEEEKKIDKNEKDVHMSDEEKKEDKTDKKSEIDSDKHDEEKPKEDKSDKASEKNLSDKNESDQENKKVNTKEKAESEEEELPKTKKSQKSKKDKAKKKKAKVADASNEDESDGGHESTTKEIESIPEKPKDKHTKKSKLPAKKNVEA